MSDVLYTVHCINNSNQVWTFVISDGAQGLAWKQTDLAPGANSYITWYWVYGVAIAQVDPLTEVYSPYKSISATVGKGYSVFINVVAVDIEPCSEYDLPDQIRISNNTSEDQLVGLELGSDLISVDNCKENVIENYTVASITLFIGAYNDVPHGKRLISGQSVTPVPINFTNGQTNATATLSNDNIMIVTFPNVCCLMT